MTQHVAHRHSDEIAQLRAEIELLRAVLQDVYDEGDGPRHADTLDRVRRALEGRK